ncbi:hypothetical protein ACFYYM_01100 [Streptomyces erythrochromogenes]|uniref:hypothetical protein n=1 Tax=Streptomyces erythrochromogenes TaxID=285574 RepID=UPI003691B38C
MNAARTRADRAPARTRRPGPARAVLAAARFPVGLATRPVHAALPQSRAGAVLALFAGAPLAAGPTASCGVPIPARTVQGIGTVPAAPAVLAPAPGRLLSGRGHGRPRDRAVRPAGHVRGHPRRVPGAASTRRVSRRDGAGGNHLAHVLGPGPGFTWGGPAELAADGLVNARPEPTTFLAAPALLAPLPTRPAGARPGASPLTHLMKEIAS